MIDLMSVLLLGLGSFAIRVSAIAILGRGGTLPAPIEQSLQYIAPAVLSALVANTLLLEAGEIRPLGPWHLAALCAGLASFKWASTTITLVIGMVVLWTTLAIV